MAGYVEWKRRERGQKEGAEASGVERAEADHSFVSTIPTSFTD